MAFWPSKAQWKPVVSFAVRVTDLMRSIAFRYSKLTCLPMQQGRHRVGIKRLLLTAVFAPLWLLHPALLALRIYRWAEFAQSTRPL